MIKTISKKISVDVLENVICDACGNSCMNSTNYEYMTLSNYWGYGSNKDGEIWEAHICEKCVDEKFQFIKFRKEDYTFGGINTPRLERKIVDINSIIIAE